MKNEAGNELVQTQTFGLYNSIEMDEIAKKMNASK